MEDLKAMEHRVLFQNADVTINMGAIFNDPDIELYDIYWYLVRVNSDNETLNILGCLNINEAELMFFRFFRNLPANSFG